MHPMTQQPQRSNGMQTAAVQVACQIDQETGLHQPKNQGYFRNSNCYCDVMKKAHHEGKFYTTVQLVRPDWNHPFTDSINKKGLAIAER
jgi:hypothetical protein